MSECNCNLETLSLFLVVTLYVSLSFISLKSGKRPGFDTDAGTRAHTHIRRTWRCVRKQHKQLRPS